MSASCELLVLVRLHLTKSEVRQGAEVRLLPLRLVRVEQAHRIRQPLQQSVGQTVQQGREARMPVRAVAPFILYSPNRYGLGAIVGGIIGALAGIACLASSRLQID